MSNTRILCVFAHYDPDNRVQPYVLYYLRSLRSIVHNFVFVSTSGLGQVDVLSVNEICDTVILRENIGYDFCSYRLGLESVEFSGFDQIILCNDSVYGPLMSLAPVMEDSQLGVLGFWGITDSFNPEYHVQSYFMVFNRSVVLSQEFSEFWRGVVPLSDKLEVIDEYEVGLSRELIRAGFSAGAWFPATELTGLGRIFRYPNHYFRMFCDRWRDPRLYIGLLRSSVERAGVNPSHYEWKRMLSSGRSVFLKVALIKGHSSVYYDFEQSLDLISNSTAYPTYLIRTHIDHDRTGLA